MNFRFKSLSRDYTTYKMNNNTQYLFPIHDHLNKFNYDDWYPTVKSILESKRILKYTESDVISEVNLQVTQKPKTEKDLENAKVEDSKAKDIQSLLTCPRKSERK